MNNKSGWLVPYGQGRTGQGRAEQGVKILNDPLPICKCLQYQCLCTCFKLLLERNLTPASVLNSLHGNDCITYSHMS